MKSPKVPSKDLLVGRYYGSDIYQSADKTFFFAVADGKTVVCQSLKGLIREVAKRRKALKIVELASSISDNKNGQFTSKQGSSEKGEEKQQATANPLL